MEQGGAGRWSDAELHGALARVFGYTAFRPHQIEIVKGVLGGHDSLSIMPTGGGKSLCFQLPSHLMDGVCVVISPLISLMKDQVDAACANGLRAAALNSSLSPAGNVREARPPVNWTCCTFRPNAERARLLGGAGLMARLFLRRRRGALHSMGT
ncbi:MAG: DEAD/DEAH box helicase [Bilophila wadsworthia]